MSGGKLISAYIVFPDEATAEKAIAVLLDERLIACANVFEAKSHYRWRGQIERASETVVFCKTIEANWEKLAARAAELHPYEVPAILKFGIEAAGPYRDWLEGETKS